MNWSAQISSKSEVSQDGLMTYEFVILKEGEPINGTLSVTSNPSEIQDLISAKVIPFAQAYELAETLPGIGDVLEIITDQD